MGDFVSPCRCAEPVLTSEPQAQNHLQLPTFKAPAQMPRRERERLYVKELEPTHMARPYLPGDVITKGDRVLRVQSLEEPPGQLFARVIATDREGQKYVIPVLQYRLPVDTGRLVASTSTMYARYHEQMDMAGNRWRNVVDAALLGGGE